MSSVVVVSVWGSQTGAEDETYDFKIGEAPRKHVRGWVHVPFPDSEARELLGRQVCEHTCMKPTDKLRSGLWPEVSMSRSRKGSIPLIKAKENVHCGDVSRTLRISEE